MAMTTARIHYEQRRTSFGSVGRSVLVDLQAGRTSPRRTIGRVFPMSYEVAYAA
jgi:hypothetical protein